jgi:hypothetical protein
MNTFSASSKYYFASFHFGFGIIQIPLHGLILKFRRLHSISIRSPLLFAPSIASPRWLAFTLIPHLIVNFILAIRYYFIYCWWLICFDSHHFTQFYISLEARRLWSLLISCPSIANDSAHQARYKFLPRIDGVIDALLLALVISYWLAFRHDAVSTGRVVHGAYAAFIIPSVIVSFSPNKKYTKMYGYAYTSYAV